MTSEDETTSATLQAMLMQRTAGPELDRDLLAALDWREESPGHWVHANGSTWQDPRPSQVYEEAKRLLRPAWCVRSLQCRYDLDGDIPLRGPRVLHWTAVVVWYTPDGMIAGMHPGQGPTEALAVCDAALTASAATLRSTID